MSRTFYTIDDLAKFCRENNFVHFSSKEFDNKPLIVQSMATFDVANDAQNGLMPVELKSCHFGLNRNGSYIAEDVMKSCMESFKGRPILGAIYKTDTGEYEFRGHDTAIDENGEYQYIEQPVGVISQLEDPYLKYDEDEDKTYLYVSGHIFTEYSKAAEILQRRRTCKCSVEIAVNEMSWNGEEEYLSIDSFTFMGVTILGYHQDGVTEIQEGMKGSKITIDSFSEQQNSMFSVESQNKLIEVLEKLNMTLSSFNNQSTEEGGAEEMDNMEMEVTETSEEIVVDNAADEEVVEEVVENYEFVEGDPVEEDAEGNEEPEVDDEEPAEDEEQKFELRFELSHDDIRSGLYSLLWATHDCAWILEVYNGYFIYEDYEARKYYKQSYGVEDSNIAFSGEPVEVFNEWLTGDEMEALKKLKSDYAALVEYKHGMEAAELKAQKDAIFARSEYSILANDEAFVALKADAEKYSIDELSAAVKSVFADAVIKLGTFSAKVDEPKKTVGFNFANSENEKPAKAYGGLFD